MIKIKPITQAYLIGLQEGRDYLKRFPDTSIEDMKITYQYLQQLVRDFSGDVKESFMGERDFWKNQIKIAKAKQDEK